MVGQRPLCHAETVPSGTGTQRHVQSESDGLAAYARAARAGRPRPRALARERAAHDRLPPAVQSGRSRRGRSPALSLRPVVLRARVHGAARSVAVRRDGERARDACTGSRRGCCAKRPGNGPLARESFDELVGTGARLRLALDTLRHEIQGSLRDSDALTGAYGRAQLLPELRERRELARRHVQHCCIAFMDLDHLKTINDTHGHAVGDLILTGAIEYVMQHLRPYDKIFRYGGDEFLLLLPGHRAGRCRAPDRAHPARLRQGAVRRQCRWPSDPRDGLVRARTAGPGPGRRGVDRPRGQGGAAGEGHRSRPGLQLGSRRSARGPR